MNHFWLLPALSGMFLLAWLWQRRTEDATAVDTIWSFALAAQAILYALVGDGDAWIRGAVGVLGGAWGLRLGWHLHQRSHGRGEDGRYAALRERWGNGAQKGFFWLYQLQALVAWLFGAVFWAAAGAARVAPDAWWFAGVAVWLIAVGGEALADRQLERCRRDESVDVCRSGLWRYSRHPNYFFEFVHWFAYPLLAWGAPWWWVSALGPAVMLAFLWRISGIPWTEQQALRSRGEAYRRYQQTTSILIPWPPKETSS